MKRNTIGIFLTALAISCFCLFPFSVLAIPTLGVAPGEPGSGGVYYGSAPDSSSYQWVFADSFVGGVDGFAMPTSGGQLSIWYGSNSGSPTPIADTNIYLATTSVTGGSFKFGGAEFLPNNNLAVAGYKVDVFGLAIGKGSDFESDWVKLDAGEFGTGKKEFYVLTAAIEYSDFLVGDWMYAAIANSPVSDFSPKTTSSTNPVPEPTTMLLLGTGLFGLAGWRKWKSKNR